MNLKRTLTVTAAAAAVVLAPGVALADTNPQSTAAHQCLNHPELCQEAPYHPSWADVDPSVLRNGGHFTFWDRVRGFEKELLNVWPF